MAKRFSETKIWEDEWYQSLPIEWKIAWKYLCDKCDEAGIWKPNLKLADFQINEKIKWEEAAKWLNNGKIRVVITEKAWILKDFVPFQYGEAVYTSQHGFHKKIRAMLSRYPIDTLCNRVQEEEEVKEEDKEKVNKGVVRGKFDFESLWAKYPNKDGKKAAERHFHNEVKNDQDWQDINTALKNYLESDVVKKGFIKNGSTWFNNWRDWIVPPRKEETDGIPDKFKHLVTKSFPNSR